MKATVNHSKEDVLQATAASEKSELMQTFENQVHDMYWAYKDLLKAIFEND